MISRPLTPFEVENGAKGLETMQLSSADDLEIDRELASRSLVDFVKMAWHVIEPGQPYIHGIHVEKVCEHLEAVTKGQINRLLINIPPGTMKSTLCGVFWPMWEWGPKKMPYHRIIGASHALNLATRDNLRCRRLVFSQWFQERWPITLTKDQDTKIKFENMSTGWRAAMASSAMIGERGDRVLLDDPHSVEGAFSDLERETTLRWFTETVPTRLNNPDRSAIVVIMQRLHERDVSGYIIAENLGYDHLMLPMRFEKDRKCRTAIGFEDWRIEEGELLFPERFPEEVVKRDEIAMTEVVAAGQFQQRPAPRGGRMFQIEKIKIAIAPNMFFKTVRYWDKAGTEGGGKRTSGCKMALGTDGKLWILHVKKGQWGTDKREAFIKQIAFTDGVMTRIYVEQEPGSAGKESAESTVRNLIGFICEGDRPTGDKVTRAEPLSVQIAIGNVYLAQDAQDDPWNKDFLNELELFPASRFKDQVDSASGALSKLTSDVARIEAMCRV